MVPTVCFVGPYPHCGNHRVFLCASIITLGLCQCRLFSLMQNFKDSFITWIRRRVPRISYSLHYDYYSWRKLREIFVTNYIVRYYKRAAKTWGPLNRKLLSYMKVIINDIILCLLSCSTITTSARNSLWPQDETEKFVTQIFWTIDALL